MSKCVRPSRLYGLLARGQADGSFRTDLPAGWLTAASIALVHTGADGVRAGAWTPVTLTPIGVVLGGRDAIFEDHWGEVVARIILDPAQLEPDATLRLAGHSPVRPNHLGVSRCELLAVDGLEHVWSAQLAQRTHANVTAWRQITPPAGHVRYPRIITPPGRRSCPAARRPDPAAGPGSGDQSTGSARPGNSPGTPAPGTWPERHSDRTA